MKKELVILGHPDDESFCADLANSYYEGAISAGKEVDLLKLSELDFKENLEHGYRKRTDLEPDLSQARDLIDKADHIVWVFPIWWSTMPARMKGFIDRLFLPGWAFGRGGGIPEKLLKGKTSQLIVSMDSPIWYYKFFLKEPIKYSFVKGTLSFCGIKNTSINYFTPIKTSSKEKRSIWIQKTFKIGASTNVK